MPITQRSRVRVPHGAEKFLVCRRMLTRSKRKRAVLPGVLQELVDEYGREFRGRGRCRKWVGTHAAALWHIFGWSPEHMQLDDRHDWFGWQQYIAEQSGHVLTLHRSVGAPLTYAAQGVSCGPALLLDDAQQLSLLFAHPCAPEPIRLSVTARPHTVLQCNLGRPVWVFGDCAEMEMLVFPDERKRLPKLGDVCVHPVFLHGDELYFRSHSPSTHWSVLNWITGTVRVFHLDAACIIGVHDVFLLFATAFAEILFVDRRTLQSVRKFKSHTLPSKTCMLRDGTLLGSKGIFIFSAPFQDWATVISRFDPISGCFKRMKRWRGVWNLYAREDGGCGLVSKLWHRCCVLH